MSNIFRKPSSIEERKNKYEIFGFKYNPFPVDPAVKPYSKDERENGSIYMTELRKDEILQFKKIVIESTSKVNLLMDYAAYRGRGIGKTAFLNYLKKEINKDLGDEFTNGQQVLYAVYVSPGGEKKERKFNQLARLIFEAVCNEDLMLVTFCRLRAATGLVPEHLLETVTYSNLKETLGNEGWLSDNRIDIFDLDRAVGNILRENGVAILLQQNQQNQHTLFEDPYVSVKKLFSIENTDIYWKKYGVDVVFSELVRIFKAAEFSHIYILFDEAEKIIISQNFGERREFVDNLRYYFVDGSNENANSSFYKLLMTIHPNSQELLLSHWNAAGLDRFSELGGDGSSANTIFFRPLKDYKLAVQLAKEYLSRARINTAGEASKDDLSPFDEKSLEKAIEISDGIPGRYLKLLYNAIEQAVSDNWGRIDTQNIDNIWKKIVEVESKPSSTDEMIPTKTNMQE